MEKGAPTSGRKTRCHKKHDLAKKWQWMQRCSYQQTSVMENRDHTASAMKTPWEYRGVP